MQELEKGWKLAREIKRAIQSKDFRTLRRLKRSFNPSDLDGVGLRIVVKAALFSNDPKMLQLTWLVPEKGELVRELESAWLAMDDRTTLPERTARVLVEQYGIERPGDKKLSANERLWAAVTSSIISGFH